MDKLIRPVWAEINLDHLAHNIREVRRVVRSGCGIAAVVKADGKFYMARKEVKVTLGGCGG